MQQILPQEWSSIKNAAISFKNASSLGLLQEFSPNFLSTSTSRTATLDLSSKKLILHQEQYHQIFLPRMLFNQRCSSIWFFFKNSFQNQEQTYQIFLQKCSSIKDVAAGFLSPLIFSIILHRKIRQRQTLFQELSPHFLFSAASLSSYFLGYINASNSWKIFIPTSVLLKN